MRGTILRTALLAALLACVALTLTALAGAARHAKSGAARPGSATHPSLSGTSARAHRGLVSHGPSGTVYDQYDNDTGIASSSQNFEADFDAYDDNLADDFTLGSDASVGQVDAAGTYAGFPGPVNSFHVTVYGDSSGSPGTTIQDWPAASYTVVGGSDFRITLDPAVDLSAGVTYWISVQANMDFGTGGQWYWEDRSVQNGTGAMWENPGGGFGVGCTTWTPKLTCIPTGGGPDQVYSLSSGGGGGGGDHYAITNEGGGHSIVAGTDDLGSSCDDCDVPVSFPFPVTIYGQQYTSGMVSSNGNIQFTTDTQPDFTNSCLPAPDHGAAFFGFWDDGYTMNAGYGIFTTTTGSEPNRTFYIEYRGQYFPGVGSLNYEYVFNEGSDILHVIYGTMDQGTDSATLGIQDVGQSIYDQYLCNGGGGSIAPGDELTYTPGGPPPPPGWTTVSSMPSDEYGGGSASDGTYTYVFGGYSFNSGTVNTTYRYDPGSDTWTTLAPIPLGGIMQSAVYDPANNKIYVFGGEDADTAVNSNATYIYDIATDSWSTGANMPDVRSFMASGYDSGTGHIFLASGYNTGDVTSAQPDVWEYDPGADTFTSKAPIPHPLGGAGSGIINGKLYVEGGRDANNVVVNDNQIYDIASNSWSTGTTTAANNVPGSAVANGMLWTFGGGNPFIPPTGPLGNTATQALRPLTTGATRGYDPVTDSWTDGPNLNEADSFVSGSSIDTLLVAAGGYNGSFTSAVTETWDVTGQPPPPPPPTPNPTPPPPPPPPPPGY
jgi:hypothetical protein